MDLIDRQQAIDAFDAQCWERINIPISKEIRNAAKDTIKALPAVQPQSEIIRCKDCRHRIVNDHYGEKGYLKIKGYCELDTGDPFELGRDAGNDDWFCADAERREAQHEHTDQRH